MAPSATANTAPKTVPSAAPTHAIEFIDIAGPREPFADVCARLRIARYAQHGVRSVDKKTGIHFSLDEEVLAVIRNARLATQHNILSVRGYLVTTRGRVCRIKTDADGFAYVVDQPLPEMSFNSWFFRGGLLAAVAPLSGEDPDPIETVKKNLLDMQERIKAEGEKYPFVSILYADAYDTFGAACDKLALHWDCNIACPWLLRDDGRSVVPLQLLPYERPVIRAEALWPASIVVTSAGRTIWCQKAQKSQKDKRVYCLDEPVGEPLTEPWERHHAKLTDCAKTHLGHKPYNRLHESIVAFHRAIRTARIESAAI